MYRRHLAQKTCVLHFQIYGRLQLIHGYILTETLNTLLDTYQGNKSPRRLVVQKLKTVAFQIEDCPNKHKQQGESKSARVVRRPKYSHLQTVVASEHAVSLYSIIWSDILTHLVIETVQTIKRSCQSHRLSLLCKTATTMCALK